MASGPSPFTPTPGFPPANAFGASPKTPALSQLSGVSFAALSQSADSVKFGSGQPMPPVQAHEVSGGEKSKLGILSWFKKAGWLMKALFIIPFVVTLPLLGLDWALTRFMGPKKEDKPAS